MMTASVICRINTTVETLMTDLYCRIERNQDKTSTLSQRLCPWTRIPAGVTQSRLLITIHTYITITAYMFPDFMSHDQEIITQETWQSFNKSFTSGTGTCRFGLLLRGQWFTDFVKMQARLYFQNQPAKDLSENPSVYFSTDCLSGAFHQ